MFLKDTNNFTVTNSTNATRANTLTTARTINGTSFNGSANITTANWGTARNLTIGNTAKSVNGSANVSWSLSEIGAAAANHTHNSTMTGNTYVSPCYYNYSNGILIDFNIAERKSIMFHVEVIGNGYSTNVPIHSVFCFYDYGEGGIFNPSGTCTGVPITMTVFRHGGKVKAWIKQTADFQTLSFRISFGNSTTVAPTITHAAMPTSGVSERYDIVPRTMVNTLHFTHYGTDLSKGNSHSLRIRTPHGYLDAGPMNNDHCHFQTDRPVFHFNKEIVSSSNLVSDNNGKRAIVGTGGGDVYLHNSRSGKYLQLKDNGTLGYSDSMIFHDGHLPMYLQPAAFNMDDLHWIKNQASWNGGNKNCGGIVSGGTQYDSAYNYGAFVQFGGGAATGQIYLPENNVQNDLFFRCTWSGQNNNSHWKRVWHNGNFDPNSKLNTTNATVHGWFDVHTSNSAGTYMRMCADATRTEGGTDWTMVPSKSNYGVIGRSSCYWYIAWAAAWRTPSYRKSKYDIRKADDSILYEYVKNTNIYNYRRVSGNYDEEKEASDYRGDLQMGAMIDELPFEVVDHDTEFGEGKGVDLYAYSSMTLGGLKHTIKQVEKQQEIINSNKEEISMLKEEIKELKLLIKQLI